MTVSLMDVPKQTKNGKACSYPNKCIQQQKEKFNSSSVHLGRK